MRVLVTGAGGFVGRALVKALSERGESVVALLRDRPGRQVWQEVKADGTVVAFGTVTDRQLLERLLVDYGIDVVFHLAAESAVRKCYEHPEHAVHSNVLGTASVLEACRRRMHEQPEALRAIVVATTDKVYGANTPPYTEEMPIGLGACGIYEVTKVAADLLAHAYYCEYRVPVRIVRSCNVYGPGDLDVTRLIPRTTLRMLQGLPAILYDGAEGMRREFVFIDDEIAALVTVAECGANGEAYNVAGTGAVAIGEVVRTLADMLGGRVEYVPRAFHEIPAQWMDATKLVRLGWSPTIRMVPDGLARTVAFYQQYLTAMGGRVDV